MFPTPFCIYLFIFLEKIVFWTQKHKLFLLVFLRDRKLQLFTVSRHLQLRHFNQREKFRNQTLKIVVLIGLSHLAEDESRKS